MKTAVLFGALSASLFASDLEGLIQSIDTHQKTIRIQGSVIKVLPYTKIEQESCGIGWDSPRTFKDLKVGDWVKVDLADHNPSGIAEEIEIQCHKHRAY